MAQKDISLIIGICKSKEKSIISQDKLNKILESNLEEGLKLVLESGFASGVSEDQKNNYDAMCKHEQNKLLAFCKENAPSEDFLIYTLADNDFHNAECMLRSKYIKLDKSAFVAEGMISLEKLEKCLDNAKYDSLPKEMQTALKSGVQLFESGTATGFNLSCIFSQSKFQYKSKSIKSKLLNHLVVDQIDNLNIAMALRSRNVQLFNKMKLSGGKIDDYNLNVLLTEDLSTIMSKLKGNYPKEMIALAVKALQENKPLIEFENKANSQVLNKLMQTRYDVNGIEPIVLYYHYKLNEIANVKVALTGISNGEEPSDIKLRMRVNYAG